jgi:hypothetical protein
MGNHFILLGDWTMNTEILTALKSQLNQISGMLTLAKFNIEENDLTDHAYWIKQSHAQLVGLIQGLNIIIETVPEDSMAEIGIHEEPTS